VALAVEADVAESIGAAEGLSLGKTLLKLKESGYNTVVLNEEKVADLVSSGEIQIQAEPGKVRISGHKHILQRILKGLTGRVPSQYLKTKLEGPISVLELSGLSAGYLGQISVGLNPLQAKAAQLTGFVIVARCGNPTGATKDTVEQTIAWARKLGAVVFVPLGDQVLGRRELLKTLASSLEENKMLYASPEFSKIGGDAEMLDLNPNICVRLHSAQTLEIDV
jgi:hypothetical protein